MRKILNSISKVFRGAGIAFFAGSLIGILLLICGIKKIPTIFKKKQD